MKEKIKFSDFLEISNKLEIKVGKITRVEVVPKSSKLLKLTVDFGDETRIAVTNIKPLLTPTDVLIEKKIIDVLGIEKSLEDKIFPFITNLEPVTMMGIESTVMIMPGNIEVGDIITINSNAALGTKLL